MYYRRKQELNRLLEAYKKHRRPMARKKVATTPRAALACRFVYVDQAGFEMNKLKEFAALPAAFTDYQRD